MESIFTKTSRDDSSRVELSRRLFLPYTISLVYFTLSLSQLDFRQFESIPRRLDSTRVYWTTLDEVVFSGLVDHFVLLDRMVSGLISGTKYGTSYRNYENIEF